MFDCAIVRAITENHADKLIDLLRAMPQHDDSGTATHPLHAPFQAAVTAFAEDFGADAAKQLEAYARRQASLDESTTRIRR